MLALSCNHQYFCRTAVCMEEILSVVTKKTQNVLMDQTQQFISHSKQTRMGAFSSNAPGSQMYYILLLCYFLRMTSEVIMNFCIKLKERQREEHCFLMPLIQHEHTVYNPLVKTNCMISPRCKRCIAKNIVHGNHSQAILHPGRGNTNAEKSQASLPEN